MSKTATTELHEAGGRIPFREGGGDKYKVRIMGWTPGAENVEGSSALYPVEALKRDIPMAFPEGTRMRANHDGLCEAGGDIRRVIARTLDTPWEEADGMYTNIRVSEEWSAYVKEYGDIIGLSISAAGELQQIENEDGDLVTHRDEATGLPILKRLMSQEESPYNSIDFVEAPGADGRIVAAIESAQKRLLEMNIREQAKFASGITEGNVPKAVPPTDERKEHSMDPKEIEALVERAATEAAAKAVESLKPVEESKEVKGEDVAEAAFKAGLSEGSRQAVYEHVAAGMTVEAAITKESAREKQIEEAITARLTPGQVGYTTGTTEGSKAHADEFDGLVEGGLR